jgi:hypothetical protein
MNEVSLSIELEHHHLTRKGYPTDLLEKTALQITEWWGLYGLLPVVYHSQIQSNKHDPAEFPRSELDQLCVHYIHQLLK